MKYWLYSDGNILGPYEPAELLAAPDFTEESLVCDDNSIGEGRDDWRPAAQIPELAKILKHVLASTEDIENAEIVTRQETEETEADLLSKTRKEIKPNIPEEDLESKSINSVHSEISEEVTSELKKVLGEDVIDFVATEPTKFAEEDKPKSRRKFNKKHSPKRKNASKKDIAAKDNTSQKQEENIEDLLSSLDNILGAEQKEALGADAPPAEVNDFKKDIESNFSSDKPRDVRGELDSVRMETDLLLGQIKLQELNENNIRKRISELTETLKSNTRKLGGKSVFEEEKTSAKEDYGEAMSLFANLPTKDAPSGADSFENFISDTGNVNPNDKDDVLETEFDDSKAATIKLPVSASKKDIESSQKGTYDVTNGGRPPVYVYEFRDRADKPQIKETVTKINLSDDLRSGQIYDDTDEQLSLLPQQAGGGVYDFTALSVKPVHAKKRKKLAHASDIKIEAKTEDIGLADIEIESNNAEKEDNRSTNAKIVAASAITAAGLTAIAAAAENSNAEEQKEEVNTSKEAIDTESFEPQQNDKVSEQNTTDSVSASSRKRINLSNQSGAALTSRTTLEEQSKENTLPPSMSGIKANKLSRRGKSSQQEEEANSGDEGPLLQEITKRGPLDNEATQGNDLTFASSADEERLLQEAYDSMMASQELPAEAQAGNMLQAASIEGIGASQQDFAVENNPFKAADIYSTPQQNVQAEDLPAYQPVDTGLNTVPLEDSNQDILNDFADYYVDEIPEDSSRHKKARKTKEVPVNPSPTPIPSLEEERAAKEKAKQVEPQEASVEENGGVEIPPELLKTVAPSIAEKPSVPKPAQAAYAADLPAPFVTARLSPNDILPSERLSAEAVQKQQAEETKQEDAETLQTKPDNEVNTPEQALEPQSENSENAEEIKQDPKVLTDIPASISSIHRSFRSTHAPSISKIDTAREAEELEKMPDFNIKFGSMDTTHKASIPPSASMGRPVSAEPKADEQLALPIDDGQDLKVSDSSSEGIRQFELNPSTNVVNTVEKSAINSAVQSNPAVRYFTPGKDSQAGLRSSFSVFSADKSSGISSASSISQSIAMSSVRYSNSAGALSEVLNDRIKEETPVLNNTQTIIQPVKSNKGSRLVIIALLSIICLILGAMGIFMLSGKNGAGMQLAKSNTAVDEEASLAKPVAESSQNTFENSLQSNISQTASAQIQEEPPAIRETANTPPIVPVVDNSEQTLAQSTQTLEPVKVSPPVTATNNIERAKEIVKGYTLSGGRGTISNWFANSFLSSSAAGASEWTATPLHASVYVVQYRMPRSRQDPLVYLFEVNVDDGALLRGINNNAIELLDTNSKVARAVPARKTYDQPSSVASAKRVEKAPERENIFQRAKKKFTGRKQPRKNTEIKQLPLPPTPKRKYSQSVPTGFEQPESDSNSDFLRAIESDEELF